MTGSPSVSRVALTTKALSTTSWFESVTEYLIKLGYLQKTTKKTFRHQRAH